MSAFASGLNAIACQLWPPAVLGQTEIQSPIPASAMSWRYVTAPVWGSIWSNAFWKIVSLCPMNSPDSLSSFHRIPCFPIREERPAAPHVDQDLLERLIEVKRFPRYVLEVPGDLARGTPDCQR